MNHLNLRSGSGITSTRPKVRSLYMRIEYDNEITSFCCEGSLELPQNMNDVIGSLAWTLPLGEGFSECMFQIFTVWSPEQDAALNEKKQLLISKPWHRFIKKFSLT